MKSFQFTTLSLNCYSRICVHFHFQQSGFRQLSEESECLSLLPKTGVTARVSNTNRSVLILKPHEHTHTHIKKEKPEKKNMLSSTCETETRVMTVQLSQKANSYVPTELSFHLHQLPITLCADSVFQNFHSWLFEWWKFESFCSAFLWLCSNLSTATAMLPPPAHCPDHAARWTHKHKHWKDCRFAPYFVATFEVLLVHLANCNHRHKLQALVHNSLPSTTAIFSYVIGSRKLSPSEQFFVGAQTVRLHQTFVL